MTYNSLNQELTVDSQSTYLSNNPSRTRMLWAAESVSAGHPDKVADQISDAVLDYFLERDPDSRVAIETLIKGTDVYVVGEVTSKHSPVNHPYEIKSIICKTIDDIGYNETTNPYIGFNGDNCKIQLNITEQSPEINVAVTNDGEIGAGDQGIIFGYATRATSNRMPPALFLAKRIITHAQNSHAGIYYPDMKSQAVLNIREDGKIHVDSLIFSACHTHEASLEDVRKNFFAEILPRLIVDCDNNNIVLDPLLCSMYINPAGTWNVGGPISDAGLTGRKIVIDQYGADCEVGGGAFSGKDPSKVDRSAAYMARYVAKHALEHTDSTTVKVQLSYIISRPEPSSIRIWDPILNKEYQPEMFGFSEKDFRVGAIIERLRLKQPIYSETAKNGHFGLNPFERNGYRFYTWEE